MTYQNVFNFWFLELQPKDWFSATDSTDQLIRERFTGLHAQATRGELFSWRNSAQGRLAEIIILDQFSRNIFRNTPGAFASDSLALVLSQEAVFLSADQTLTPVQKSFIYMPYMHSESLFIHDESVRLFSQAGLEDNLKFEMRHREILQKFGRYPHRNQILGRASTNEELEFLKLPGSSF